MPPQQLSAETRPSKIPFYRRTWVLLVAIGLLSLLVGVGIGAAGAGSDSVTSQQIADLEEDLAVVAEQRDEAVQRAAEAETAARNAANGPAADALVERGKELDQREQDLNARAAELDAREQAVAGSEQQAAQNSFGDGTHVVGQDIQPGTYRTQGTDGCYWERLSGLSGSFEDIITNGAAPGPQVVTVAESDAAFKSQSCGTWTLQ